MDPSPGAGGPRWLLCVASMPADDPASRMRVLRTLESLGTTVLREGVYLLPDTEANRRSLETLADYIAQEPRLGARPARQRGIARAARGLHAALRPLGALRGPDQDRREPEHRLRPVRPERDRTRAAQAAARVRGDRSARLLSDAGARAGAGGARQGRRRGAAACSFPPGRRPASAPARSCSGAPGRRASRSGPTGSPAPG